MDTEFINPHKKNIRDKSLAPNSDEMEIKSGFVIAVDKNCGDIILNAAKDFSDYLFTSMNVPVMLSHEDGESCIAVLLNKDIEEASGYMGYRITACDNRITVEGYDECGAAQGLYFLEDMMNLRKAPFIKKETVKRKALFTYRSTHSPIGVFDYRDEVLSLISHYGFNVIELWMKDAYSAINGDYIDLKDLAERAERYGIELCVALFAPHDKYPGEEGTDEYYEKLYGELFSVCPKIKYIMLIGESTNFKSHDPRAGKSPNTENFDENIPTDLPAPGWWPCSDYPVWVRLIQGIIKKYRADAELIFSTYNWGYAPEEERLRLLSELPEDIIIMPAWEMFHRFKRGKVTEETADYTISFPEAGEYFKSEAAFAKKRGLKLFTDSQASGKTWDFGVIPYEPFPKHWIRRYEEILRARDKWNLSGLCENIHYGFYPSFINDIEKWAFFGGVMPPDKLLWEILKRDYGNNAEAVREALDCFDDAVSHYVPTNEDQYGAFRIGPAYPLWLEPFEAAPGNIPDGGRMPSEPGTMFGNKIYFASYTPDFNPRITPAGIRIYEEISENEKMRELLQKGIGILESCENPCGNLLKLKNLAEFMYRTVTTVINVKKHYILKQKLSIAPSTDEAKSLLKEIREIVENERQNACEAIPLVRRDPMLGYEPSMGHAAGEKGIKWKIRQLDHELNAVIPRLLNACDF